MSKIVYVNSNFATLSLNSSFYNFVNIKKSFKIYQDFLEFKLKKKDKNYYLIEFFRKDLDYDIKVLIFEFLNYLISLEFKLKKI